MPNGEAITSTASTQLQKPIIPHSATIAHLFPQLRDQSLLSIGQLCNVGCIATFDNNSVDVTYSIELLLQGHCDKTTKLWTVPLAIQDTSTTNSSIHPHCANNIN
jgi:hypothetical protein